MELCIGVIGNGFVGKATQQLNHDNITMMVYDVRPELCRPNGITLSDMKQCHLIFVCVPTPMEASGACHVGLVESVVRDLKSVLNTDDCPIVIRSTVPPGTCDRLGCYFMPEFLTEKNYIQDFIHCENWILGLRGKESDEVFKQSMSWLFQSAKNAGKIMHDHVVFRTNSEAEMIKYFRNDYLATKISFCNEIEEFCRLKGIDYEAVRSGAILDSRIGESHTFVPGHDGHRGFGGTCFPKDTQSLLHEMGKVGMSSYILKSVVQRNLEVDRKEKDWEDNKGRAVV
jgi:UDPglucose 6-dehydrogenase